MTTQRSTIASGSRVKPAPTPPETPEERREAGRRHQQAHKNMEYLVEILDDLERDQPGRLVLVYGDQQVMVGDDGYAMEQSLTEEERATAAFLPIGPWTEYAAR